MVQSRTLVLNNSKEQFCAEEKVIRRIDRSKVHFTMRGLSGRWCALDAKLYSEYAIAPCLLSSIDNVIVSYEHSDSPQAQWKEPRSVSALMWLRRSSIELATGRDLNMQTR
jgi:hypothetical protein